jgi:hypothetical protein
MKKLEDADLQGKSGLFLGSEPLDDVRHRRTYKMAGDDDSDKKDDSDDDNGDDDATDSDDTDSDLTDKKDDSRDSDGRD